MKRRFKRAAALVILSCVLTLTGNGRGFCINAHAEETDCGNIYDELVLWGEAAAYLYYFAVNSGYAPESILYYYNLKDEQESIVKAQFEKMALYALVSDFPDKDAVTADKENSLIRIKKEALDTAARELYGIDMETPDDYRTYFASDGDDYIFAGTDFGDVIPESAAHGFYGDTMSGYMCLSEKGIWIKPYEFDMYLEPVENGRYSRYRFSGMSVKVPESYKTIPTSLAEEEIVSNRLMAFLNRAPRSTFLMHDFTGTENKNGSVTYECDGRIMTYEDLSEYLLRDGEAPETKPVTLGYIFRNGDHYIADYGEGLLEVRMQENGTMTFIRNKRYKK